MHGACGIGMVNVICMRSSTQLLLRNSPKPFGPQVCRVCHVRNAGTIGQHRKGTKDRAPLRPLAFARLSDASDARLCVWQALKPSLNACLMANHGAAIHRTRAYVVHANKSCIRAQSRCLGASSRPLVRCAVRCWPRTLYPQVLPEFISAALCRRLLVSLSVRRGRRRHVRRSRIRLQAHAVAGMVAVGPSLDKAMYVANEVETLCEQYSRALSVRTLLSAGASAPTVPCTHARTRIWQHSFSTSSTKPSSTIAMSARSLTGRGFSARTIRR